MGGAGEEAAGLLVRGCRHEIGLRGLCVAALINQPCNIPLLGSKQGASDKTPPPPPLRGRSRHLEMDEYAVHVQKHRVCNVADPRRDHPKECHGQREHRSRLCNKRLWRRRKQ